AAPVELVVKRRDRFAQLPETRHRRVVLIVTRDRDDGAARGRPRKLPRFRLALPEVAPSIVAVVPRRIAEAAGFGRDVDDAGPRYFSNRARHGSRFLSSPRGTASDKPAPCAARRESADKPVGEHERDRRECRVFVVVPEEPHVDDHSEGTNPE